MNFSVQFKVRGDDFGGHFINGISMADSESFWKCKLVSVDDEKNVYESSDGYKITAYHIKKVTFLSAIQFLRTTQIPL